MANRVLKETSAIRQLSILRPVPTRVLTQKQVAAYVTRGVNSEGDSNGVRAANIYLRQTGLAPKNFDLKSAYSHLMGEQILGFYDNRTRSFTTSDRVGRGELETVMAHELTHALQDQHFDLTRLLSSAPHNGDGQLALRALVEGDATLSMSRFMARDPLRSFGMFMSALGHLAGGDTVQMSQAPSALRETVTFPYVAGLRFCTRLEAVGGWTQVSKAYAHPPVSTQQILHPSLYLAGKEPEEVAMPDVRRVLRGWQLLDFDVNGELGLRQVAGANGNEAQARAAASGWAGDRYAVYVGPKGADLIVQDSLWDDEDAATLWRAAYASRTNLRFGVRAPEIKRGALSVWNAAPDGVWLIQRGRRVVMLEGTVGAFNAARVLRALGI